MIKQSLRVVNTVVAAGILVATPIVFGPQAVSADTDYNLTVPIETVVSGSEGSTHKIASRDVDSAYQGMECTVNATAKNQGSVHPNNNLTVVSGATVVELKDVEREGHATTQADGTLVLGSDVIVNLTLGEDRIFSGGMDVNIACVEREIEVCRDGSVISIKPSERDKSDTDAPCPEPTINVCRDGKVIVIKESDRRDSDTDAPCPVQINVCRDGKVVTINEEDRKSTDTDAPCEVKAVTTTLPNTGPGSVVAGITGATFIFGTAAAQIRMRRK